MNDFYGYPAFTGWRRIWKQSLALAPPPVPNISLDYLEMYVESFTSSYPVKKYLFDLKVF
jgi:hypothetical protein